jgi:hypothetical protein
MRWGGFLLAGLLLVSCGGENKQSKPVTRLVGELDMEIRDRATVSVVGDGDRRQFDLILDRGFGVTESGAPLHGLGRVERFTESDLTLYTAQFEHDATPSGPCGDQPVSLALSLVREGQNTRVAGALTIYCGGGVWHGVPVKVLRLSGPMPT